MSWKNLQIQDFKFTTFSVRALYNNMMQNILQATEECTSMKIFQNLKETIKEKKCLP